MDMLDDELSLSPHARFLKKYGMISGALFYKNQNETIERRSGRVARFHLENSPLPKYEQGQIVFANHRHSIYALGEGDDSQGYGMSVGLDGRCGMNRAKFENLYKIVANEQESNIVYSILANTQNMNSEPANTRFSHGGLHNVIDFEFLLKNGFEGYKNKIAEALSKTDAENINDIMFYEGMSDVVEGIISFIIKYRQSLKDTFDTAEVKDNTLKKLIDALEVVPLKPAKSFYQAFVTLSSAMYMSGQFETGRLDSLLLPYYTADLKKGLTSKDEAILLFTALFKDIDHRCSHPGTTHVTVGGTEPDGSPSYSELTEAAIIAIRGFRSPNVTLRVREDMPQYLWDTFLENISKGYGQPAIVNEKLYLNGLTKYYNVPFEDAVNYVFGGCAEVMIQGKTMCDSTWVAYNMLDVLESTMYNHLLQCDSFEAFYDIYKKEVRTTLGDMANQINIRQHACGLHAPYPLLTLMTGDCIENRKNFMDGGAKYNFDSTNIYGSTNAINSLYTIKQFYKGAFGSMTKQEFLTMFIQNYNGFEAQKVQIADIKKFGNYDKELNELAKDLMELTFTRINEFRCYRGNGYFMPAIICWVSWIYAGARVGATPDGRVSSEPLADSAGPMQGTDIEGPTSVLGAMLSIPQEYCAGTCVLNISLDPQIFETAQGRQKIQTLFATYFCQGGCQLQINVVDTDALQDALKNPEKHRDIIVRVGGFSDNFVLLDKRIQQQIIRRTQHST